MGVLGLHLPPVAGIAVAAGCDLPKDCPPVNHPPGSQQLGMSNFCISNATLQVTYQSARDRILRMFSQSGMELILSITFPYDHLLSHAVCSQCDELRML